jgi:hypothetical protein
MVATLGWKPGSRSAICPWRARTDYRRAPSVRRITAAL